MKIVATIFSYLFHPLLSLTYILLLIMRVDPFMFGSYSIGGSIGIIAMTFFSTFIMPAIAILLLYKLDFISSIEMPTNKSRIGPLIIAMVCYFSVFAFVYKQVDTPVLYQIAVLGSCISLSAAFVINVFYKISLHAIGMGALVAMTLYLSVQYQNIDILFNLGSLGYYSVHVLVLLLCVVLLSGVVMSARLLLGSHTRNQVFSGFILGMLTILLAFFVYNQFL